MVNDGYCVADRVVDWQLRHGRHDLPWQNTRDPYRIWLSEVMLQQTQVTTVLRFYQPFLERFPNVMALAAAPVDDVMALWSGLGYYRRARHLHQCAQRVVEEFHGEFPRQAAILATLPGIGQSTAAAIAAFSAHERVAILDANVRRVLTRVLGFQGDLSLASEMAKLWSAAEGLLPVAQLSESMPRYTQGLMDLGSLVCTVRKPQCLLCPLQSVCVASAQGAMTDYPVRTKKLKRRAESWWLLVPLNAAGQVWLERRPDGGIWGQLQCPRVFSTHEQLLAYVDVVRVQPAGEHALSLDGLEPSLHVLTHRDLHLHPVVVKAWPVGYAVQEGAGQWFSAAQAFGLGLPAPVRKLLEKVLATSGG